MTSAEGRNVDGRNSCHVELRKHMEFADLYMVSIKGGIDKLFLTLYGFGSCTSKARVCSATKL